MTTRMPNRVRRCSENPSRILPVLSAGIYASTFTQINASTASKNGSALSIKPGETGCFCSYCPNCYGRLSSHIVIVFSVNTILRLWFSRVEDLRFVTFKRPLICRTTLTGGIVHQLSQVFHGAFQTSIDDDIYLFTVNSRQL